MAARKGSYRFRRSAADNFATIIPSLRAEVDHPVCALNHVQIVLDHDERVPTIHKFLKGAEQNPDIFKVKASRWLVENEQGGLRFFL